MFSVKFHKNIKSSASNIKSTAYQKDIKLFFYQSVFNERRLETRSDNFISF